MANDTTDARSSSAAEIRTFLFTDIEGSTRSWQLEPEGMATALERHDSMIYSAIARHGGTTVKHTGDGVLAVFDAPRAAVAAAVDAQREFAAALPFNAAWRSQRAKRIRVIVIGSDRRSIDVRACSTPATATDPRCGRVGCVARRRLVDDAILEDLGAHALRDLGEPQSIYQLSAPGLVERHPPLRTGRPRTRCPRLAHG